VKFPNEEKFGLDELGNYAKQIMDNNVSRAIIVIKKEITNYATKVYIHINNRLWKTWKKLKLKFLMKLICL
jgi:hypothetical protein